MPSKRIILWVLLAAIAAGGLVSANAVISAASSRSGELQSFVIWWLALILSACGTAIINQKVVVLAWVGMLAAIGTSVLILFQSDSRAGEFFSIILGIIAACFGQLSLIFLPSPRHYLTRLIRVGLIAGTFATIASLIGMTSNHHFFGRAIFLLILFNLFGTACFYILLMLEARQEPSTTLPLADAILFAPCPLCQTIQAFPAGQTKCKYCSLVVNLRFEEPRCECGYSLYKLASDRCPECGRATDQGKHKEISATD
jgi:hypothetical protein